MKKIVVVAVFVGMTFFGVVAHGYASEPLDLFDSEATARQQCRGDVVVWLDVPSRQFFLKGQKGYAGSKTGGYTCRKDAVKSGNKGTAK